MLLDQLSSFPWWIYVIKARRTKKCSQGPKRGEEAMWGNTAPEGGLAQPSHVWMIILNVIQSNALALNRFWHTGLHPNWQSEFCSRLHMIEISLNGWGPPSDKVTYQPRRWALQLCWFDCCYCYCYCHGYCCCCCSLLLLFLPLHVTTRVPMTWASYSASFDQLWNCWAHSTEIKFKTLSLPTKPTLDTNRVDLVLVQCFI